MHEYILYALLIFVPVGILMEFFLRREGLMLKFRILLESFSLAIIISFPVLISRFGMWYAFFIYLGALVALSWYFLHVSQGPSWYLQPAGGLNSDEVYAAERLIENNVVRTLGELEDVMLLNNAELIPADNTADIQAKAEIENTAPAPEQEPDNQESMAEAAEVSENAAEQTDLIDLETAEASPTQESGSEAAETTEEIVEPAAADELNNTEEEILTADERVAAANDNDTAEELNIDHLPEAAAAEEEEEEEETAVTVVKEAISEAAAAETISDDVSEEEVADSKTDDSGEDSTEAKSMDVNFDEEKAEPVSAENDQLQPASDLAELPDEPVLHETETEAAAAENEDHQEDAFILLLNQLAAEKNIDGLIENGFERKLAQQYKEAVQFFQAAAEAAEDEELKYLLVMEAVELHKENGMYAQAEQVLFSSSIGQAYKRTDIIDKINRQLSYIRLLSLELARLGLSNTPFKDVPREVKNEIAGILGI